MNRGFREMLAERQKMIRSLVCVGLDPHPAKIPARFKNDCHGDAENIYYWMTDTVEKTAPYASMYKPNSGYWEALPNGAKWLGMLIDHIHARHPDIPVLLDGKRGDIARTQEMYREAHLSARGQNADGITFSPYMGKDTMLALVDSENLGKALVGLCYTSNPFARQVQDAPMKDDRPSWEHYAEWILQWAKELGVVENAGLVMAAAYADGKCIDGIRSLHLWRARQIVGDKLWFLIPGIGTQGGFIAETVRHAYCGYGSIAINSSSGITDVPDPALAARELRDKANEALPA